MPSIYDAIKADHDEHRALLDRIAETSGDSAKLAIQALVTLVEDGFGETRLSREKAIRARTWIDLEKAFEEGEVVEGVINGRVKGGFTVEIDNVRAFLPGSLVDVRPVRDPGYLEGKSLEFKVIKLDRRRNNVVVSRRAVVETEFSAEREALLESLQEGILVEDETRHIVLVNHTFPPASWAGSAAVALKANNAAMFTTTTIPSTASTNSSTARSVRPSGFCTPRPPRPA